MKKYKYLYDGEFGIEKENIRVDKNGKLALTEHPKAFGGKKENPYFTVDFSESQVEMITPVFNTIDGAYDCLLNMHDVAALTLKDEYLWPQSMPPLLPSVDKIPIGKFENTEEGRDAMAYRNHLVESYGEKKQMLSGIHFNFSFGERLIKEIYKDANTNLSMKDFKTELYLKVVRNFYRYSYLLICLFGNSPIADDSYWDDSKIDKVDKDCKSLRNSYKGYVNPKDFFVDYSSLENYHKSLERAINDGYIDSPRELYQPIRIKNNPKGDLKEAIDYIEVRVIDLNPMFRANVDKRHLAYLHMFLLFCAMDDDYVLNEEKYFEYINDFRTAAFTAKFVPKTLELNHRILNMYDKMCEAPKAYKDAVKLLKYRMETGYCHINELRKEIEKSNFIDFHLNKAKEYLKESQKYDYRLYGYEDIELSTQILIKSAMRRGLVVRMLDREDNFISLSKGEHIEYLKQATKSSLDSYVTFLMMENKIVSKNVLEKSGIHTPQGKDYDNIEMALEDFPEFDNKKIVIKPKSTNFGLGISIFENGVSLEEYKEALKIAFSHDTSVLVEEFQSGTEYRFLVIGDESVAIVERIGANIIGDGKSTIKELVEEENKNPLRGIDHRKPLEQINLDEATKLFLESQGKDFNSIPLKDEMVLLRKNSNVSTGGVAYDHTDDMHQYFKDMAVKAAKSMDAKVCGVDIIIEDKDDMNSSYSIIEVNFNPSLYMHNYPYVGKNRRTEEKFLDVLFPETIR